MTATTVTVDVSNKGFSGVKKHVEHDKKLKHTNKNIDQTKTKYNRSGAFTFEQKEQLKHKYFDQEFKQNNDKYAKRREWSKQFKSVDEYVAHKEKKVAWEKTAVATFGNKKDQDERLKGLSNAQMAQVLQLESKGLVDYVHTYNMRNKFSKIVDYTTNVDESTPHIHMGVLPLGRTKTGKVSMSWNAALKQEYEAATGKKVTDSRVALSWWREREDNALTANMSHTMGQQFELKRTHEHVDDFDSYKKVKQALDKKENELNAEQTMTKGKSVELIREIEPEATIRDAETQQVSDPIKTQKGAQTFQKQPFNRLMDVTVAWVKRLKERVKKENDKLKAEWQKIKEKKDELIKREKNLDKRERARDNTVLTAKDGTKTLVENNKPIASYRTLENGKVQAQLNNVPKDFGRLKTFLKSSDNAGLKKVAGKPNGEIIKQLNFATEMTQKRNTKSMQTQQPRHVTGIKTTPVQHNNGPEMHM